MINPIEALIQNDPNGFRDSVHDMLMSKLSDRLEAERPSVAASLFGKITKSDSVEEIVDSSEDDTNV